MVKHVKNMTQFQQALRDAGGKLVVVDFTAAWCGPCRMIAPIYEKLSETAEYGNVVFLKVDVDEAEDVSGHCRISSMPTFQFYKNGEKMEEFSGANPEKLKQTLDKLK